MKATLLSNDNQHAAVAAQSGLRLLHGALAHGRGVYDALIGMQQARARGVRAQLSIADCGADYLLVRRFVLILGLERDVRFIEPAAPGESALLPAYDVLLVPALLNGLPSILLEAMAFGIPAIARRTTITTALIAHGRNGWLLDEWTGDAIAAALERIAAAPALLSAMKRSCRFGERKSAAKITMPERRGTIRMGVLRHAAHPGAPRIAR